MEQTIKFQGECVCVGGEVLKDVPFYFEQSS